jgi:hypothetical protein
MNLGPVLPFPDPTLSEQEAKELLAHADALPHGGIACSHEFAHRFMIVAGNPDRRQIPIPQPLRQHRCIPPIVLLPVTQLARNEAWRDDDAVFAQIDELTLKTVVASQATSFSIASGVFLTELI